VANLKKGETSDRIALKRLYDTKITRFVKIRSEANPYDTEWKEYFEKRMTYKMLLSLNGRKSLLHLWEMQNHVCPLCGLPIDKEHSWGVTEKKVGGKMQKYLVHDSCRRRNDQLKRSNNELVSN
jgi:RNA-directed DNA polymerase